MSHSIPAVVLVTMVAATSLSASAFSLHAEDAMSCVPNDVLITLGIEPRALVNLDGGWGFVAKTCLTKDPESGKVKFEIDIVSC